MAVISQVLRAASYQAKIHVSISAHKYSDGTVSNLLIQFKDNSVLNISDEFLPNTYENDFIICEDGFLMMHIKKINEYLSSIGGSVKLHSKKFVGNNLTVEIPYQPKIKKPPRANDKGNVVNLSLSSNKA